MKQREAISKHFNPIEYIQCTEFFAIPAVFISGTTSTVNIVLLMKTADVVKNSGHCIYSIGLKCFLSCFLLFHLVIYAYVHIYIYA